MKAETLKIIGSTIFWTFFVMTLVIDIITYTKEIPDLYLMILRQVSAGFELFGISLEIAGWRIEKKEQKKLKESEGKDNE